MKAMGNSVTPAIPYIFGRVLMNLIKENESA